MCVTTQRRSRGTPAHSAVVTATRDPPAAGPPEVAEAETEAEAAVAERKPQ